MSISCASGSVEETLALGAALAESLVPAGVLLLTGDLGSGKTVLTQGLATALDIDPKEVQSPSYTLVREHRGSPSDLIHIDLYRLEPADVDTLGLWEIVAGPGVKVVEWAERLPFEVADAMRISIVTDPGSETRRFTIDEGAGTGSLGKRIGAIGRLEL